MLIECIISWQFLDNVVRNVSMDNGFCNAQFSACVGICFQHIKWCFPGHTKWNEFTWFLKSVNPIIYLAHCALNMLAAISCDDVINTPGSE